MGREGESGEMGGVTNGKLLTFVGCFLTVVDDCGRFRVLCQ